MTISAEAHEAARKIKPLGDRILARYTDMERKIGSLWVPGTAGKSLDVVVSQVISMGKRVTLRPWDLIEGEYILHVRTAGLKYDHIAGFLGKSAQAGTAKDADYVFLFEKDILGVVDPESINTVTGAAQYSDGRTGEWHQ